MFSLLTTSNIMPTKAIRTNPSDALPVGRHDAPVAAAAVDIVQAHVECKNPFPRVFGFHEVFHSMVILASAIFYLVVAAYVLPF